MSQDDTSHTPFRGSCGKPATPRIGGYSSKVIAEASREPIFSECVHDIIVERSLQKTSIAG
jgi:hypothetical protein